MLLQGEKQSIEEFARNFRSLWDKMEAFGRTPSAHKGIIDSMMKESTFC